MTELWLCTRRKDAKRQLLFIELTASAQCLIISPQDCNMKHIKTCKEAKEKKKVMNRDMFVRKYKI